MTAPFFTSDYRTRKRIAFDNIFTVEVEDTEGDTHTFEVTAEDFADAAKEAENLAWSEGIDVNIMHVYIY